MSDEMKQAMTKVRSLYRANKAMSWNRAIDVAAKLFKVNRRKLWIELESEHQAYICKSGQARGRRPQQRGEEPKEQPKFQPKSY